MLNCGGASPAGCCPFPSCTSRWLLLRGSGVAGHPVSTSDTALLRGTSSAKPGEGAQPGARCLQTGGARARTCWSLPTRPPASWQTTAASSKLPGGIGEAGEGLRRMMKTWRPGLDEKEPPRRGRSCWPVPWGAGAQGQPGDTLQRHPPKSPSTGAPHREGHSVHALN